MLSVIACMSLTQTTDFLYIILHLIGNGIKVWL